jgi:hypothetical protein
MQSKLAFTGTVPAPKADAYGRTSTSTKRQFVLVRTRVAVKAPENPQTPSFFFQTNEMQNMMRDAQSNAWILGYSPAGCQSMLKSRIQNTGVWCRNEVILIVERILPNERSLQRIHHPF